MGTLDEPFGDTAFQWLLNQIAADALLHRKQDGLPQDDAIAALNRGVKDVLGFERDFADLFAAKRWKVASLPYSESRERQAVQFFRGFRESELPQCRAAYQIQQAFLEGRATMASQPENDPAQPAMPQESAGAEPPESDEGEPRAPKKGKRSTQPGEGRTKLISALTLHHKYADGSCLNLGPVGNNELARLANVSPSTANNFFNHWFGSSKNAKDGLENYKRSCSDKGNLIAVLKAINDELPRPGEVLFGRNPPGEMRRGEDEE